MGFVVSLVDFLLPPVENVTLGLTLENFWKLDIYPDESSIPHRGNETGCAEDETRMGGI